MMQICRAELGLVHQVNANLYDIQRQGGLRVFLNGVTGVDPANIIAFLSDGQQLRDDNLRELAGAADQSIFVFNREYLDADIEDVYSELTLNPGLQPLVGPSRLVSTSPVDLLEAYMFAAQSHHDFTTSTLTSLHFQHESLRIASTNLDLHVLSLTDVFEAFAEQANRELEKQAQLLAGRNVDLAIIARVTVHPQFLSQSARKGIEAGGRGRTLGDYVLPERMKAVAETCVKLHEELRSRFQGARDSHSELIKGAEQVRMSINASNILEQAEVCTKRSLDCHDGLTGLASSWQEDLPNQDAIFQEIEHLDGLLRQEVEEITRIKNQSTKRSLTLLRTVSQLQSIIVTMPATLSALEQDLRLKTPGFSHLQRLHSMFYVYAATVVEVVRRKEFARFFNQRAQTIAEIMAKLTSGERKRRQVYRGEVHGQLPFETRGMDEPAPTLEISTTGGSTATAGTEGTPGQYTLEREDFPGLFQIIDAIEKEDGSTLPDGSPHPVIETRQALEKLITRMDNLEADFDRMAERSILSASRIAHHKRRTMSDAAAQAEQLREVQLAKEEQERVFHEERARLEAENSQLRVALQEAEDRAGIDGTRARSEQERANGLELDLHKTRSQNESDCAARRLLETRHAELQVEVEQQRQSLSEALADATTQTHRAETLQRELAQAKNEGSDVRLQQEKNAEKVAQLLDDQATTLANLEAARMRGEDLQAAVEMARVEGEEAKRELKELMKEKERLLKIQANEADRLLRDHKAEADGDRAVLEHHFSELKAEMDAKERKLKDLKAENGILIEDGNVVREEVQRTAQELRELRHKERERDTKEAEMEKRLLAMREQITRGVKVAAEAEGKLERSEHLLAGVLEVAIAFRDSHHKALVSVQNMLKASSRSSTGGGGATHLPSIADSTLALTASILSPDAGTSSVIPERPASPTPIDPIDHASALDTLREFDLDAFADQIAKTGSTIRKWQKQCKEYRERAKGKISFRNFTKGDLALFLPTRNSIAKPWAAFNVSFPHYFLQATGQIAEQLKAREWIVARITSITERVVDPRDPTSNPYGLGDGVKYFLLEVEDWTQPSSGTVAATARLSGTRSRVGSTTMPTRRATTDVPAREPAHVRVASSPLATTSLITAREVSPPANGPVPGPRARSPTRRTGSPDPRAVSPKSEDPETVEAITTAPTSHLFPARTRTASGGRSSLSKLLAQAPQNGNSNGNTSVSGTGVGQDTKTEPTTTTTTTIAPPSLSPLSPTNGTTTIATTPPIPSPTTASASDKRPSGPRTQPAAPTPSPKNRLLQLQPHSGSPGSHTGGPHSSARRPASIHSTSSSRPSTSFGGRVPPPFAIAPSAPTLGFTTAPSPPSNLGVGDGSGDGDEPQIVTLPRASMDINASPISPTSQQLQQRSDTPSPADSAGEGMGSVLLGVARRRTTSTLAPRSSAASASRRPTSPLVTTISPSPLATTTASNVGSSAGNALASLASSWGVSFGRRNRTASYGGPGTSPPEQSSSRAPLSRLREMSASESSSPTAGNGQGASDLLRKFDSGS